MHCIQALSIQVSPSEYCVPSNTHSAGTTSQILRNALFLELRWGKKKKWIVIFYLFNSTYVAWHLKELSLTSEVEVALHRCSRATSGPQKKPGSCKHPVNPSELHLHLWPASGSSSPFSSSFYTSGASQPQRGGVVIAVMWSTGLAMEGVGGAIHWEWGGGLCLSRHEPLKW